MNTFPPTISETKILWVMETKVRWVMETKVFGEEKTTDKNHIIPVYDL